MVDPPNSPIPCRLRFCIYSSVPAQERVAFLMREAFDSESREVAETLATTEPNARQLVLRAREHLRSRRAKHKVDPAPHADTSGRAASINSTQCPISGFAHASGGASDRDQTP